MHRYERRIRSLRPGQESWGTVAWFISDNENTVTREANVALAKWKHAAMDAKSPLWNWEFKIENPTDVNVQP
jgi:hypothetical protein